MFCSQLGVAAEQKEEEIIEESKRYVYTMSSMCQGFVVNRQHHGQVQCEPEKHCQEHVVSGAGGER